MLGMDMDKPTWVSRIREALSQLGQETLELVWSLRCKDIPLEFLIREWIWKKPP
jgi:hypothetical protein